MFLAKWVNNNVRSNIFGYVCMSDIAVFVLLLLHVTMCCSNCGVVCIGYELSVSRRSRYVWGVGVGECGWKNSSLWNTGFELALCRCCVLKVDVTMYEFVNEFMYINSVKCLAHVINSVKCSCQVLQYMFLFGFRLGMILVIFKCMVWCWFQEQVYSV